MRREIPDNIKRRVQANFGRQAVAYNANRLLADKENLRTIVRMAQICKDDRVLDVASGTGFLAQVLTEAAEEVVASDLTIEMLSQSRLKTSDNLSFCLADSEQLPFSDNCFDAVTCRVALHHFTRPEESIREMRRVCVERGRVVIMDVISSEDAHQRAYHNRMERLRDASHVQEYSNSELLQMFEACRLQVDKAELWQYRWDMEEWLAIANPAKPDADEIRRMMRESVNGDKSGLAVEIHDNKVYFTYTASIIIAHK